MTTPGVAPGSVPPLMDDTARRIRALEQRVDELSRRDLSNANVGQGGSLRGLYPNGAEAFLFGRDSVDGGNKSRIDYSQGGPAFQVRPTTSPGAEVAEVMEVLDQVGNVILQTDPYAGYGLIHPALEYTMSGYEAVGFVGATTQATALELGMSIGFAYHYCRHVIARLRFTNSTGATQSVSGFVEITDLNGNVINTSSLSSWSIGTGVITINKLEKMVSLPETAMATRVNVRMCFFSPSNSGNVTVQTFPQMCLGIGKNWYDTYPGLH